MSNSFQKVQKIDPFTDPAIGDWAPDKKHTNKDTLAFIRSGELNIEERYAQEWVDPKTSQKKKIFGRVKLTEYKFISKQNSEMMLQRQIAPLKSGAIIKDKD